jgi:hypothetical protein
MWGSISDQFNNLLSGDFNNDGIINVVDIVSLVNQIISDNYNSPYDLNGDNIINILDVIIIVNIILELV